MSYIVRTGNLWPAPPRCARQRTAAPTATPPSSSTTASGAEDGSYRDQGTIVYSLTVFGSAAEQLVETAQASGNVRVLFAGYYRVREYDRHAGGTGISHNVMVDEIGVSLTGQRVVDWSRRRNGGEA